MIGALCVSLMWAGVALAHMAAWHESSFGFNSGQALQLPLRDNECGARYAAVDADLDRHVLVWSRSCGLAESVGFTVLSMIRPPQVPLSS